MRSGALRHKVKIQRPIISKESGAQVTNWEDFRECRASIEMMKSFDKSVAQATYPAADTTINIRYSAGITGNMRVVHGDDVYSILGLPADPDGRKRELILTCERGVKTS